ncbi:MAG: sigma-70 family RNA polymerase sigma factor [Thermoanaerobaculia bacterium]|nr:sigma-70 family RNA polymerase sigma factor [Thermoanaerobaculia bacterium]
MSSESSCAPWAERAASARRVLADLSAGRPEEECFRRLVALYYRPIVSCFRKRGCDADLALDLTQDVFHRIYTGVRSFRGEAEFDTWVFRIAVNVWRQRRRFWAAEKRSGEEVPLVVARGEGEPEEPLELPAPGPSPLEGLLAEERSRQLAEAIAQLPEGMRRCLLLRVQQDLKYREIAVILKLSPETVKVHLFKARQKLEALLGPYFHPGLDDEDSP